MLRLALAGLLLLASMASGFAQNAPTYRDSAGNQRDAQGVVLVSPLNGAFGNALSSATYYVTGTGYTAYATPTDFFCITGSATKTIRVVYASIRPQSTTGTMFTVHWIKRSTANSGGTSTQPTPVKLDSADGSATAAVNLYTAAPTLGTAAGTISITVGSTTVLTTAPATQQPYANYGGNTFNVPLKLVTLRGASESLCANFNGAALPSGFTSLYEIAWIED